LNNYKIHFWHMTKITAHKPKSGNKHVPFGEIPEKWEIQSLRQLGSFSKGSGITKKELSATGYPCVRYGEIYTTHDFIIKEFKSFIAEDVAKISKRIKGGDILFAGSGETREDIGKAVAFLGAEVAYAGGDVIIFSPDQKRVNSECLSYCLETQEIRRQRFKLGAGNQIVHIYPNDLGQIKLSLPSLPEQKAIAAVLSTWDKAISNYQLLIINYQFRKKWLMQQLLTGKKRLKGFKGEWKEERLGAIAKIKKGEQLSIINMINDGDYYVLNGGIEPSGYTVKWNVAKNTITISEGGNSCGFVKYNQENFWCGGHCYALLHLDSIVNDSFLLQMLKYFEPKIMALRVGSGLPNIQLKALSNFSIDLPELSEQHKIAKILKKADDEIDFYKQKLDALKEQKKGLMQVLLTGKKKVKGE
jgi:type I restriction enzyme, S subunit